MRPPSTVSAPRQDGPPQSLAALARHRRWVIAVVASLTYASILGNKYTLDDDYIRQASKDLREASMGTLFDRAYFGRYHEDTYRPVVTLTYMFDLRVGGRPVVVAHAQNIAWHAGTAVLVSALAARLLPAFPELGALAAGLAFAVHPAGTEAVDAIGYREDTLAAFFCLAVLLLTLRGGWRARAGALGCYVLALFSKENAAVAPALLLLARLVCPTVRLTRTEDGRLDLRAMALELVPFAVLTAAFLYVRFGLMKSTDAYADPIGGSYRDTLVAVPRIFAHYVRQVVIPWPMSVDYANQFPFGASLASQVPWLAFCAAYLGAALLLARRRPVIGYGLLWFVVALMPMLHFIPIRFAAADRFIYMALVGGALAAGGAVAAVFDSTRSRRRARQRLPLIVASAIVLAGFALITDARNHVWRTNRALWTDALEQNPYAYTAHFGMYVGAVARKDYPGALREVEAAVESCPRASLFGRHRYCAGFANALGFLRLKLGDVEGARAAFLVSSQMHPSYVHPMAGLGMVALRQGDLETARTYYDAGRVLNPLNPEIIEAMDDLQSQLEKAEKAAGVPPEPVFKP